MKTYCKHPLKRVKIFLVFITLIPGFSALSQTVPELVFQNPVLESGIAGHDSATYRFSNVTTGIDAVLEIKGRSAPNVVVNSIDMTSVGFGKALQPEVGIPGNVAAGQSWWVDFNLHFYKTGTFDKAAISSFKITGLDIDGDGSSLNEWIMMNRIDKISYSSNTLLLDNVLNVVSDFTDPNNNGEDHKISGPVANFKDIDTTATSVMATYSFTGKDHISFRIGANTNGAATSAGMRMNSFWFKEFDLSTHTLPVTLMSFSAELNKDKANLKWSTASEINVSHFVVEKSLDGKHYQDAALVFAYGNSSQPKEYTFNDDVSAISSGILYYRLKMQDMDGTYVYSNVRMIRIDKGNQSLSIDAYPNPVSSDLHVTLPAAWQGKEVTYQVYNVKGSLVKSVRNSNASQTENINMYDLNPGLYIIRATMDSLSVQQKIIKN
ncbi:MAG: T9SS type A sorting domain-containing protein [Terrimonas sp.]|nr:T9SS type A sorting domain-containing protein [Terrimonas sp.]